MCTIRVPVYNSYKSTQKLITTDIINVKIKRGITHKHILSISGVDYKIQFYAPTWLYNGDAYTGEWNKHCGKVRCKRYVHLYKKKSLLEQINYINLIIELGGCYLIRI